MYYAKEDFTSELGKEYYKDQMIGLGEYLTLSLHDRIKFWNEDAYEINEFNIQFNGENEEDNN